MKKSKKRKRVFPRKHLGRTIKKVLAMTPAERTAATRAGVKRLEHANHPAFRDAKT